MPDTRGWVLSRPRWHVEQQTIPVINVSESRKSFTRALYTGSCSDSKAWDIAGQIFEGNSMDWCVVLKHGPQELFFG